METDDKKENLEISREILKMFYDTEDNIVLENGEKFDIPIEGSLGLLTLGYRGIIAWRKKKMEFIKEQMENKKAENK